MQRCIEKELKRAAAALLVVAAAAGLGACNRVGDPVAPAPKVSQAPESPALPAGAPDTTPKASEVFKAGAPPDQTSTNARPTDASHQMTKQEESKAMPMPGQANDHSTLAKDAVKN
jgi:hypothetical protein